MKYALKSITLALLLYSAFSARAFEYFGYLKVYPILQDPAGGFDSRKILQNMGKIQVGHELPKDIYFEGSYELITFTQKHLPHQTPVSSYRIDDLNYYLHDETDPQNYKTSVIQNLNRFNLSTTTPIGDVIAGRQIVSFGVSKSLSPTDVLTPFSISTIDKEERQGVDALILRAPIIGLSTLEVGIVAGEDFEREKSAYYLRPKVTIDQLDMTATLMEFKERKLLGLELTHPIKDAGFWIEGAYIDSANDRLKNFMRVTTGVDYKFQSSLYLAMEYHYNGSSLDNGFIYPEDYIYVYDYHYFIPTFSYEFTPLLKGSIQSYINAHDGSVFTTPKLEYNWSDNLYLSVGVYAGLGNETTSEFGRYGQTYYSSLRYYF